MTRSAKAQGIVKSSVEAEPMCAALTDGHAKEVMRLSERAIKRGGERPRLIVKPKGGGGVETSSDMAHEEFLGLLIADACGTVSDNWKNLLSWQVGKAGAYPESDTDTAQALGAGIDFMRGVAPANEIEAALAAQMFAIHNATMLSARRAAAATCDDSRRTWLEQANKGARTFTAQTEALSKMRGGGRQIVEVKHTYVDARNSQNVIAETVTTAALPGGGGRGPGHVQRQPHAPAEIIEGATPAPGLPMRSEDAEGLALSGTGRQRQGKVSNARR